MNRSCPVNQRKPSSARLATALLPNLPGLKLEQVKVEHGEHREDGEHEAICFTLRTTTPTAQCPICHQPANHVHSRYTRTLSDLPWGSFVVRVLLHVRRFFCAVQDCARRIFTERLPTLVVPYARRTTRLVDILRLLGLAVGGRAGSRLVKRLQMGTSFSTMLRLIRQMPEQYHPTPRVLGVDDWAMRKGQTYGSILCDLERRRVIDLLPDRSAETLAQWLQQHPGVEVVSRDQGGAYAEGASQGAPQAVQVADRWHLLKNLGDTLKEVLARDYPQIRKALLMYNMSDAAPTAPPAPTRPPAPPASPILINPERFVPNNGNDNGKSFRSKRSEQRRQRRIAKFEEVRSLRKQGLSFRAIAVRVGLDKKTVRKFVMAPAFPEYAYRRGAVHPRQLDLYKVYIMDCWQGGCHNAAQIWREMVKQGYRGGRTSVRDFAKELRLHYQHFDRQDNRSSNDRCDGNDGNHGALCSNHYPTTTAMGVMWLLICLLPTSYAG
jgi:transposase